MLPALALGVGLLLSPDNLRTLGNLLGRSGWPGLGLVMFWALFYLALARSLGPWPQGLNQPKQFTAVFAATLLCFAAPLISTGILVSSGFVFNEIFLAWFPNFGFAFLVLGLALTLQFLPDRIVLAAQTLFVLLAAGPVLVLAALGLARGLDPGSPVPHPPFSLSRAFTPMLLWVGFDLFSPAWQEGSTRTPAARVILLGTFFFLAWGLASILSSPLDKLAQSGLPHLRSARDIFGDNGRYLMGAAVIFGTLAAVNALFFGCRDRIGRLLEEMKVSPWTAALSPLVLAGVTAAMMAGGLAGSRHLETWIQAVFVAWLLFYALICAPRGKGSPFQAALALLVLLGAGINLYVFPDFSVRAGYLAVILGSALTLWLGAGILNKKNQP